MKFLKVGQLRHPLAGVGKPPVVLIAALAASALAVAGSAAFDKRMSFVVAHVTAEPGYKRLPLDTTPDRQWFYAESEALFKKEITKEQYVTEGTKRFPGFEASLEELATLFSEQ